MPASLEYSIFKFEKVLDLALLGLGDLSYLGVTPLYKIADVLDLVKDFLVEGKSSNLLTLSAFYCFCLEMLPVEDFFWLRYFDP